MRCAPFGLRGLEGADEDQQLKRQEEEADRFVADLLITPEAYWTFRDPNSFDTASIQRFAGEVGISAGIVVGRLQNDGLLAHSWQNHLRERFGGLPE